jgi:enamine deaminase RidA (YjgF/YER057c/UK114 family)
MRQQVEAVGRPGAVAQPAEETEAAEAAVAGLHRRPRALALAALKHPHALGALLWEGAPMADVVVGSEPAHGGRTGGVAWRSDGRLMFGALELALDDRRPLAAQAEAAYGDVFAALREAGLPRLLRVWNYLPAINDDDGALLSGGAGPMGASERYRQFNIGRQAAFLAHGQDAFAGSPAACALGREGRALAIRFVAGSAPTHAVDNPRQVPAWRYPTAYGPKSPTFSRASLVAFDAAQPDQRTLLVSGTASIVGHESRHIGDVRAQTRETLANLDAVLAEASRFDPALAGRRAAELHTVVYLRHPDDRDAVAAELAQAWGPEAAARAVWQHADACRRELLVEIEGHLDPRPAAPSAGAAA